MSVTVTMNGATIQLQDDLVQELADEYWKFKSRSAELESELRWAVELLEAVGLSGSAMHARQVLNGEEVESDG